MKKEEVHPIPFVSDPQTFLPSNKREIISEFQEELFQAVNESVFKGTLGVLILEAKELQDHWVLYFFLGSQLIFWNGSLGSFDQCGLVPGECCALIELSCDLTVELPDRPSSPQRFSFIKDPRLFALHSKQADVVRPWQGKSLKPSFLMFT